MGNIHNTMTEDEARTKLCPFRYMTGSGMHARCAASECALWHYTTVHGLPSPPHPANHGRCGLMCIPPISSAI